MGVLHPPAWAKGKKKKGRGKGKKKGSKGKTIGFSLNEPSWIQIRIDADARHDGGLAMGLSTQRALSTGTAWTYVRGWNSRTLARTDEFPLAVHLGPGRYQLSLRGRAVRYSLTLKTKPLNFGSYKVVARQSGKF